MNKNTLYLILAVAAVAGVGYYIYKKNQAKAVTTPTAPVVTGEGNPGGVVGEIQDAWDAIFGKS